MTIDKDRLKALAEAALCMTWYNAGDVMYHEPETGCTHAMLYEDQEFIAAVTPQAVLALLAENERLERHAEFESKGADDVAEDCIRKAKEIRRLTAENESGQKAFMQAARFLATITSSDGSGHADLARSVLRIAGIPDSEATAMVDQWVANRPWGNNKGESK